MNALLAILFTVSAAFAAPYQKRTGGCTCSAGLPSVQMATHYPCAGAGMGAMMGSAPLQGGYATAIPAITQTTVPALGAPNLIYGITGMGGAGTPVGALGSFGSIIDSAAAVGLPSQVGSGWGAEFQIGHGAAPESRLGSGMASATGAFGQGLPCDLIETDETETLATPYVVINCAGYRRPKPKRKPTIVQKVPVIQQAPVFAVTVPEPPPAPKKPKKLYIKVTEKVPEQITKINEKDVYYEVTIPHGATINPKYGEVYESLPDGAEIIKGLPSLGSVIVEGDEDYDSVIDGAYGRPAIGGGEVDYGMKPAPMGQSFQGAAAEGQCVVGGPVGQPHMQPVAQKPTAFAAGAATGGKTACVCT